MAINLKKKTMVKKKKVTREVKKGIIYISSSFNNTLITITDQLGNTVAWSSAGSLGFKGSRKSTPYAAQMATLAALDKAKNLGLEELQIRISGVGAGREQAVRSLIGKNVIIESVRDVTPIPHGGCRPKKPRRV